MLQHERPIGFLERRTQSRRRLIQQNRTDKHASIGHRATVAADQLVAVIPLHHPSRHTIGFAVAAGPFRFGPDQQPGQHLQPRPVASMSGQHLAEPAQHPLVFTIGPGPSHRDDRQHAMPYQQLDTTHGPVKCPGAPDRVVGGCVGSVDRHAKLEAVRPPLLGRPQPLKPLVLQHRRVGQYRGRAISQGQLQHRDQLGIQKRLAPGEVILAHTPRDRFGQHLLDRLQRQEAERVVVRAAADEAVRAGQVAERAGDLEPEFVQATQFNPARLGHRIAHDSTRSKACVPTRCSATNSTCSRPTCIRNLESRP